MFSDTRFGDFPHYLPTRRWTQPDDLFTGWMLLSYRKAATASSTRDTFPASNVPDEDRKSFWVADHNRAGEWLTIDLGAQRTVRNALVSWKPVRGAVGYNVRWGIGPRKLYQTYQVFADRPLPLEIRALTVGQSYWFAVEAFDENGVSKVSEAIPVR